jgi:hypothetical protein
VEHQGSFRLANTRDQGCTQCHAGLKTTNGRTEIAANVTSFDSGHPDFRTRSDPGTIKLNHEVHLKRDLRGPHGPVQLKCQNCHSSSGEYMAPVNYEQHCAECHPLVFDKRFSEPVPHKKPEVIQEFITRRFTEYIAVHPEEVHMVDPADPRILRPPLPPARDAAEWISRRVSDTDQLLSRKTCKECHALIPREPLPDVAKAAIPARWLTHAYFDHDAHQGVACTGCHARASSSHETSDVLIPGIQTCRQCHHAGSNAAESRCFECHVYHDWTKERKVEGGVLRVSGHE